MFESQFGSMECEPSDFAAVGDRRLTKRASIFEVAADRVAKFRQMDANLVGPTSFKATLEFAETSDSTQRSKVRHRSLACVFIGSVLGGRVGGASSQTVASVTNEV